MSCAAFTFIGLFALVTGKSNAWTIGASLTAAVVFFYVAAFLAWREEHLEKIKAQKQLKDEEPKIVFGLIVRPVQWAAMADSQDFVFTLTNHGKRAALYSHIDPIESVGGHYTLYFEDMDVIPANGNYCAIAHEIKAEDQAMRMRLGKKPLWDFLHNNPLDGRQFVEYSVIVNFQDIEEKIQKRFKMRFDLNTKELSIAPETAQSQA